MSPVHSVNYVSGRSAAFAGSEGAATHAGQQWRGRPRPGFHPVTAALVAVIVRPWGRFVSQVGVLTM